MSRKSFWRRQTKSIQRGDEHDFLYREGVRDAGMYTPSRTQSMPSVGTALLTVTGLGHAWATTGNLAPPSEQLKSASSSCVSNRPRRVTFLSTVRVVLIPPRTEYRDGGMANNLWWEECDYSTFKNSAIRELRALMALKLLNSKAAQQVLYQPGFHLELDFEIDTSRQGSKSSPTPTSGEGPCSMDASPAGSGAAAKSDVAKSSASSRLIGKSSSTPNLETLHVSDQAAPPSPTAGDMGLICARTDVDLNKMHPHAPQPQHLSPTSPSQQVDMDRGLHPLALLVE